MKRVFGIGILVLIIVLTVQVLVLRLVIETGNGHFSWWTWWEAFSSFVQNNKGSIVSAAGGICAAIGTLVTVFKYNPKIKAWFNTLGVGFKTWCESFGKKVEDTRTAVDSLKKEMKDFLDDMRDILKASSGFLDSSRVKTEKQEAAILALIEAFEDVVKLSGASEEKKDIYIKNIENAKTAIGGVTDGKDRKEI